ncbi:MAG: protein TolA [Nevskia sp.]|nr:protein TolA [Nevskia sp.]
MNLSRRHLLFALLLHLALFGLLFTGVQCSRQIEAPPVMQGVLINPSDLPKLDAAQPKQLPDQPPEPPKPPEPKQDDNAKQVEQQKQAAEQQAQAKAEADTKAAAAAKSAAEAKAKAEIEATQKEKAELQAKADADAKAKAEAETKANAAAKTKADAEAKARDDLAKQTAAEEQQRKADAAKQAAAERKQREQELQQQLGQESKAQTQAILAEWNAKLIAAIASKWERPPGIDPTLKCKLHLNLSPSGQVLSVSIVASSGNALFDGSVQAAVSRASPLPLPRDPSAFDPSINVTFTQP